MIAPEKIWVAIDRRGKVECNPDAHVKPCDAVASAFTEYTRTDAIPSAAYVAGLEAALRGIKDAAENRDIDACHEISFAALANKPAQSD